MIKYLKVLFGLLWFYSVYYVHFGSLQSQAIQSTLVMFGLFGLYWSYSVHSLYFGLIQLTLVLFVPIRSITSTLVIICPFILIWSTLVLFGPPCSYSAHFFPFASTPVYLFHFGPFFCTYIQGKDMFGLRASIIYIYISIKLVISKILNITFIIATLFLSHIDAVFQTTWSG